MFKNLLKAVVSTALLPVDVIKDIATMGGEFAEDERSTVMKQLENIGDNFDKATDPEEDD